MASQPGSKLRWDAGIRHGADARGPEHAQRAGDWPSAGIDTGGGGVLHLPRTGADAASWEVRRVR
ncbi:MAG: hypothetical protein QOI74_680 [Micromonosporaceae bacterium]|nr:hypothetical protein [Micromonosporaceae bacterium]